ncbi:MAG: DUF4919 domain-containing protein [Janthinobacterium lividum]
MGILYGSTAGAQRISRIDFDSIKVETTAANSRYYHAALLKRFQEADTTLTRHDFQCLYYGQVFTKQYALYGGAGQNDFMALYNREEFAKAIPQGEKLLAAAPLDLKLLFKLLVCYHQLGDRAHARQYAQRYFPMLRTIMASGDGQSRETAYVVVAVPDEYQVLRELNLASGKQALVGHTDVLTVTPLDDNGKPTGGKESQLYFDVTQSLAALSREFNKK